MATQLLARGSLLRGGSTASTAATVSSQSSSPSLISSPSSVVAPSPKRNGVPSYGGKSKPKPAIEYETYVIADLHSLEYLESCPRVIVVDEMEEIQGYEVYIVEQWACARNLSSASSRPSLEIQI